MGNKYSQTNEAKEKYTSPLLEYMRGVTLIDPKHIFTRDEIAAHLNCSDRMARKEMEKLANYYPIISVSSKQGYRLGSFDDKDSYENLKSLQDETRYALSELQSRIESLQARMRPLIALYAKTNEQINMKFGIPSKE